MPGSRSSPSSSCSPTHGALIVWFTAIAPEYGDMIAVAPGQKALAISEQVAAAEAADPGGRVDRVITPYDAATPSLLRVQTAAKAMMVAVNPYTGAILSDRPEAGTWNEWLTNLHGEHLIGGNGGRGDLLVEIAASLVLWWKRRPAGAARLVAPPRPEVVPCARGAVLIPLARALVFPVLGLTLLAVLAIDTIVLAFIPPLKRALS